MSINDFQGACSADGTGTRLGDATGRADDRINGGGLCSCAAETLRGDSAVIVVLRIGGELDMATRTVVHRALLDAIAARPHHLVVDLTSVTFCGITELSLIVETGREHASGVTEYLLSGMSPHLRNVCKIVWDGDLPPSHRTVAAAVTALRSRPGDSRS